MNANNLPANASPSVLPVERRLPQPEADATALVRLITDQLNPVELKRVKDGTQSKDKPVLDQLLWILNSPHPISPEAKIVRMYHVEDGVEVYSSDGQLFVRTFIPEHAVRFFDEIMSEEAFVSFIEDAESDEEEPEDPEDPEDPEEPEEPEEPESAPPGQTVAVGPSGPSQES